LKNGQVLNVKMYSIVGGNKKMISILLQAHSNRVFEVFIEYF